MRVPQLPPLTVQKMSCPCPGSASTASTDAVAAVRAEVAATGTGEYDLRVSALYRRHWWSIPSQIKYMTVSVDNFLPEINKSKDFLRLFSFWLIKPLATSPTVIPA